MPVGVGLEKGTGEVKNHSTRGREKRKKAGAYGEKAGFRAGGRVEKKRED